MWHYHYHTCDRLFASSLYSQDDIDAAIDVVKNDFMNDWWGCELTLIYYAGDERCKLESTERGVETMVLFSDFKTGKYLGDESSLNTNDTYKNWSWILVRSEDRTWKLSVMVMADQVADK